MAVKRPQIIAPRTLLIEDIKGEFRVTIPGDAKITFGPAFVSKKDKDGTWSTGGGTPREYALRIYQGTKENLLACFLGVRGVRDVTIEVTRKVMSEAGKTIWRSDEKGYEVTTAATRDFKFVDANQLTSGKDEEKF